MRATPLTVTHTFTIAESVQIQAALNRHVACLRDDVNASDGYLKTQNIRVLATTMDALRKIDNTVLAA
jgi:hypothetical protein